MISNEQRERERERVQNCDGQRISWDRRHRRSKTFEPRRERGRERERERERERRENTF